MTEKEFELIKEVINECLKYENICPAVSLVSLYRRFQLIDDKVGDFLYRCLNKGIYVTCSMYDELKEMEQKNE